MHADGCPGIPEYDITVCGKIHSNRSVLLYGFKFCQLQASFEINYGAIQFGPVEPIYQIWGGKGLNAGH